MHRFPLALTLLTAGLLSSASAQITPTTTLARETGNNTSAANTFVSQTNGNVGAGNVSKVPIRSLLYSGANTKMFAHLMPWFGTSSHMNVGYNSATSTQANNQVADMMSRGFDGTILDWYGPKNTQVNNASLYIMQAAQATSGKFQFAIMEDVGALNTCAATAGCDLNQQVISDLTYIVNTYGASPAYVRIGGRPAIFFFGLEKYTLDFNVIRAGVPGNPLFIFRNAGAFTKTQSNGAFGWVSVNKTDPTDIGISYLDYYYSTALKYPTQQNFATGYKGFNDLLAAWTANRIMNQDCGQTWLRTFAEISKYYSTNNQLPMLQVATWNDYEEGTEIESGIDNCVAVSGSMSGQVLNWSISGQENTVDHYTVFISMDGVNLMPVADLSAGTHSLDLSSYGFTSGSYTLYVKAVGKPSLTNKMSGPIAWSIASAGPVAQLSVTPDAGIAPVTISASTAGSTGTITNTTIDFGDGTVVSGTSASHSYSGAGNYVVSARVTDKNGATSTATHTVSIAANQPPVARVTVSPSTGVAPVVVTVDASASSDADGSIASATISFGDGTVITGLKGSHTYNAAGNYTVIVTVTDNRGANGSTTANVSVTAPHVAPTMTLSVSPMSGIAPLTVSALADATTSTSTAATVVINWGDGSASTSGTLGSHIYTIPGNYTITATATDSTGASTVATAGVSVVSGTLKRSKKPKAPVLQSRGRLLMY